MKQSISLCLFTIFLLLKLTYSLLSADELSLLKSRLLSRISNSNTNKNTNTNNNTNKPLDIKLPDVPVYYENWMKYHHSEQNTSKPKNFFQNNQYYHQPGLRLDKYKSLDSNKKRLHIPSPTDFYIVVYKDYVSIYSDRVFIDRKQIESFPIKNIDLIPEDKITRGGVRDIGPLKAGYCMQVFLTRPSGSENKSETKIKESWIFCMEQEKEKQKFMKMLIMLKLKKQRLVGNFLSQDKIKTHEAESRSLAAHNAEKMKAHKRDTSIKTPSDGYWIKIQDWTSCSLKCGGGWSYQQWRCIPPRNGGQPCQGDAIRKKACNLNKCPDAEISLKLAHKTKPKVKTPIIKTGVYFSKLKRTSKCLIKEDAGYLSTFDPETKLTNKLPIRLVMNNYTVSLYGDDTYQKLIHSFEL